MQKQILLQMIHYIMMKYWNRFSLMNSKVKLFKEIDLIKFLSLTYQSNNQQSIMHQYLSYQQKSFRYFQIDLYHFTNQHLIVKMHLLLLYLMKYCFNKKIHINFILIFQFLFFQILLLQNQVNNKILL